MTNHHDLEFDLADRIRKAMRVAGLDQQTLASAIGVTGSAISGWVRAVSAPDLAMQGRIARATGVPMDWLVRGPGREPTPAEAAWMRQIAGVADDARRALADLEDALHEAGQRGPDSVQALADHLIDRLTAPKGT